jgi:hypothetical protein
MGAAANPPANKLTGLLLYREHPVEQQQRNRTRGVADIVFLLCVTRNMAPCSNVLHANSEMFIDTLSSDNGNQVSPIGGWRARIADSRDFEFCQVAMVENPFVCDPAILKISQANLTSPSRQKTENLSSHQ